MDSVDLGYPLREPDKEPFLFLTGTIVLNKRGVQRVQETHMRPPDNGWRMAYAKIDKGELLIWCDKLTYRFRHTGMGADIECVASDGKVIALDPSSMELVRCIESQVDGNIYKPAKIVNKKKK